MECFIGLLSGCIYGNPLEPQANHVESLGQLFCSVGEAARAQAVGRPCGSRWRRQTGSDPLTGNPIQWAQL